jgi:hypothetical protein
MSVLVCSIVGADGVYDIGHSHRAHCLMRVAPKKESLECLRCDDQLKLKIHSGDHPVQPVYTVQEASHELEGRLAMVEKGNRQTQTRYNTGPIFLKPYYNSMEKQEVIHQPRRSFHTRIGASWKHVTRRTAYPSQMVSPLSIY